MIQLKNSILEGIFEKDDLYVITLRNTEFEEPFTLGSEFKPEIEDWKEEVLYAIELANKSDVMTPESACSADKYSIEDPPSYLLDALRLLNKHVKSDKSDWRAILFKDNAIIKKHKSCSIPTYKITISIENANISLALNAITYLEGYSSWHGRISGKSLIKISKDADIVQISYKPGRYLKDRYAVCMRHSVGNNKYARVLHASLDYYLEKPKGVAMDIPVLGFYIHQVESSVLIRGVVIAQMNTYARFAEVEALRFVSQFAKLSSYLYLAPVYVREANVDDEEEANEMSSFASVVNKSPYRIKNLDTGQVFLMDQTDINLLPSQPDVDKIDRTKNLDKSQLNILDKYRMSFPSLDDNTLCRFLKARNFQLDKAESLLKEALEWRESSKPELITLTEVEKWANMSIVIRHGQDKQGRPLLILRNNRYIPKNIDLFEFEKYVLYVLEKSISEMPPNVDTFCIISDMKEAKLSNFNLSHTRHFIPIIQDYYPERLGAAFIVNFSWVVKSIWATVKVFLNEATLQKIQFLDSKEMPRLLEYFDENQLAAEYGGKASVEL